ncbi:hypothetical protein [Streptomyces sp. NPDC050982]|uniref:hypothetical protein n=1 Tax=Streptomyces sp. NPDC050982 TaxID=3154746 RepID=UPI0033D5ACC9
MGRAMRGASVVVIAGAMLATTATMSAAATQAPAPKPGTERITLSATGEQGNDRSYGPEFSADGRFALFSADASNLVPGDTNASSDVYLRDLRTGSTRLVSESVTGGPVTDNDVTVTSVGPGARRIGLSSHSAQLVPDDTNGTSDGFVRRLD